MENLYKRTGVGNYKEGLSHEEQDLDKERKMSFEEEVKFIQERGGDEIAYKNHQRALIVEAILREHGYALTEDACYAEVKNHPEFDLQPAMLFALAQRILEERKSHN